MLSPVKDAKQSNRCTIVTRDDDEEVSTRKDEDKMLRKTRRLLVWKMKRMTEREGDIDEDVEEPPDDAGGEDDET